MREPHLWTIHWIVVALATGLGVAILLKVMG